MLAFATRDLSDLPELNRPIVRVFAFPMRMGLRIASSLTAILASVCLLAFSGCHAAAAERIIHFINVHGHYVPSGPGFPPKSKMAVKFGFSGMPVSELFASMGRWGVDVFVNELSPSTIWLGGTQEDYGIPKLSELYPNRIVSLYGGPALRMLYRAVEAGNYTRRQQKKFVRLVKGAMQSGEYKGFGEIGLHHMETVKRNGPIIPADHPWMLILADIAAKYDAPIDIHMEATDENLGALERLLAHNRKAKIIWAHTGWSELGHAAADVWERLMARNPNLYGSIKHRTPTARPRRRRSISATGAVRSRRSGFTFWNGFPTVLWSAPTSGRACSSKAATTSVTSSTCRRSCTGCPNACSVRSPATTPFGCSTCRHQSGSEPASEIATLPLPPSFFDPSQWQHVRLWPKADMPLARQRTCRWHDSGAAAKSLTRYNSEAMCLLASRSELQLHLGGFWYLIGDFVRTGARHFNEL